MGQKSIRIPDALDKKILALALERQTSYTEVVIWAMKKYFDVEDEFIARQDRRTVSGRVPVAEDSRVAPVEKEPESDSPTRESSPVGEGLAAPSAPSRPARKVPSLKDTWGR